MSEKTSLNLSEKRLKLMIFCILSLYVLVGMGIDLIAPSLPAMSRDLHLSAGIIKNLIAIYLAGYAISNFIIGFVSDALGRRKLLLINLSVFVLVSLLPTFFTQAWILLGARFLQGASVAGFTLVSRAVLADVLPAERLMRIAPLLATMWGMGPVIGPVIGGYLQYYFNWQAGFYFLAAFGLLELIAMALIIPETHLHPYPFQFAQFKNNFVTITTHRLFIGVAILMGISYSLLIVFNTLGPFLIQTELGHSPIYFGHIALWMGLIFLVGTTSCRRLIKRFMPQQIIRFTIPITLVMALLGLLFAYLYDKNMAVIVVPSLAMFLSCGLLYPSAMGQGLALFRHMAGSSGAVMNGINFLITSLSALLMSLVSAHSAVPLLWIYVGLMVLAAVTYLGLIRPRDNAN